jgi:hypothetical protein
MKLIQELSSLFEGALKDSIIDAVDAAMDKLNMYDFESYEAAIKGIMAEVNKHIDADQDSLESMVRGMYTEEDHEEALKEDSGDSEWPKVIAKADEFRVELDEDEQVHLKDGEGNIRVSMPLVIWKQLSRI